MSAEPVCLQSQSLFFSPDCFLRSHLSTSKCQRVNSWFGSWQVNYPCQDINSFSAILQGCRKIKNMLQYGFPVSEDYMFPQHHRSQIREKLNVLKQWQSMREAYKLSDASLLFYLLLSLVVLYQKNDFFFLSSVFSFLNLLHSNKSKITSFHQDILQTFLCFFTLHFRDTPL